MLGCYTGNLLIHDKREWFVIIQPKFVYLPAIFMCSFRTEMWTHQRSRYGVFAVFGNVPHNIGTMPNVIQYHISTFLTMQRSIFSDQMQQWCARDQVQHCRQMCAAAGACRVQHKLLWGNRWLWTAVQESTLHRRWAWPHECFYI